MCGWSGQVWWTKYSPTTSFSKLSLADPEVVNRDDFFNHRYGTLAILPKVKTRLEASNANSFLVLTPCSKYQLKSLTPPIWLQFNHYLPDTNSKPRHLGVFIVTFGRTGATMPLEVFRNENWVRPNNNQVLGELSEVVDLPWTQYMSLLNKESASEGKLSDFDQVIKGPWHATPVGGKEFSWDYRKFWQWAALSCKATAKYATQSVPDFENVKVSTRLINYSPTPRPDSKFPVVFDIRSMDEENTAAFIAIYALEDNGQDIREWYWIKRAD